MTIEELLLLPWSWTEPKRNVTDGVEQWVRTIKELPEFFVAAASREELDEESVPALAAYLQSYLERGQEPPAPNPGRRDWVFLVNGQPLTARARGDWERLDPTPEAETAH
jgi:predicted RNase H-like HicB family nuclease